MTVSKYFNQNGIQRPNREQELIHGWTKEAIQINGEDVFYLQRQIVKEDWLFGEDPLSHFTNKSKIEMYIEDTERYSGLGDILTEFGAIIKDQVNLHVAQRRFTEETGMKYPREGDLIYFPFFNRVLWEIKHVEDERQFYPLGTLPSFKLRCNHFELNGETFETGIPDVDQTMTEWSAPTTLQELEDISKSDNQRIEDEAEAVVIPEDNIWGKF